ncbi:hypothetical protein J6590_035382 [Homalodisca vitripennis]|nr:hypothetical protein J6590_035382 [Homalodisca vitripennis]
MTQRSIKTTVYYNERWAGRINRDQFDQTIDLGLPFSINDLSLSRDQKSCICVWREAGGGDMPARTNPKVDRSRNIRRDNAREGRAAMRAMPRAAVASNIIGLVNKIVNEPRPVDREVVSRTAVHRAHAWWPINRPIIFVILYMITPYPTSSHSTKPSRRRYRVASGAEPRGRGANPFHSEQTHYELLLPYTTLALLPRGPGVGRIRGRVSFCTFSTISSRGKGSGWARHGDTSDKETTLSTAIIISGINYVNKNRHEEGGAGRCRLWVVQTAWRDSPLSLTSTVCPVIDEVPFSCLFCALHVIAPDSHS